MLKTKLVTFGLAITISVSACGYSLVGRGSSLPPGITSVAIVQFENKTGEPNLDTIITRIMTLEFIKDGRLEVKNLGAANSVLKGVIQTYSLTPMAYDASNNVTEYKVILNILITHRATGNERLLVNQNIITDWRYQVDPSITVAETARLAATEEAAQRAAETVISLVIEAF